MENPQLLASTESFSYAWLINAQPPYNNTTSFRNNSDTFEFDFPVITSPAHFRHADEIFSDGQIRAAYDDVSSQLMKAFKITDYNNSLPAYDAVLSQVKDANNSVPLLHSASARRRYYVLEKWRKSSKRVLSTCLGFVWKNLRKSNSRVDDLERKVLEASPRRSSSSAYSVVECWSGDYFKKLDSDFDAENSLITEAILYCKRSIEK